MWYNCFIKCGLLFLKYLWLWILAPFRDGDAISMAAAQFFGREQKILSRTLPEQLNIALPMISNSLTPNKYISSGPWNLQETMEYMVLVMQFCFIKC